MQQAFIWFFEENEKGFMKISVLEYPTEKD